LDRIRELALAIALRSYGTLNHPAHKRCWSHSIACGVLAESLASPCGLRASEALTAGLLHDVGRIGLLKTYSNEYVPLLLADYESVSQQLTAERWQFGMDHCVSGAFLAKTWAFPPRLSETVEQHHTKIISEDQGLLGLIKACCLLVATFGYPEIKNAEPPQQRVAVLQALPLAVRTRFAENEVAITRRIIDRLKYLQS
jgi:putative nucleotidyltransferase with HDIG domain